MGQIRPAMAINKDQPAVRLGYTVRIPATLHMLADGKVNAAADHQDGQFYRRGGIRLGGDPEGARKS